MPGSLDKIRKSFEESPFFTYIGFQIDKFEEGDVLLKLEIREAFLNANDTLHGGVHATMLDIAQGMLIRSIYKCRVATINLNIHYLAPTDTGILYARARLLQSGYKIATAEAMISNTQNELVAKGSGTFKLIRDDKG